MNLKNTTIKNDDIMEVDDINVDRILLDEKSFKNILVYNILYKKFMDTKPLRIRFNKVDGIIKIYDGIRYLELSNSYNEVFYKIDCRNYNAIFDRINYLISEKVVLQIVLIKILQESEIDSHNSLPIEKKLTFPNVLIFIKSVDKKDKNNIFLEKGLYQESDTLHF